MSRKIIRQKIIFQGRVQGVGFRYRLKFAAQEHGLTGNVKNLYNGAVEAEIQGTRDEITSLIREVADMPFIRISDVDRRDIPVDEKEYTFRVEGY